MKSLVLVIGIMLTGIMSGMAGTPECADELKNLAEKLKASDLAYKEPDVDTHKATFGMDCFWGVESLFGGQPGIIRVKAGYTGGQRKQPTYRNLGDHTESVEIEFDPAKTSYPELLDVFWASHDATERKTTQYMSAIFYHDDAQRNLAEASKAAMEEQVEGAILTRIAPAGVFYDAENYHQKYFLRQHKKLVKSLGLIDADFLSSWRATRLLGFITGNGDDDALDQEKKALGLTDNQLDYIKTARDNQKGGMCSGKKDEL